MYTPGSVVYGTLSFYLKEAKPYKYIQVALYGLSHVLWTESREDDDGTHEDTYESSENHVSEITTFWKEEESLNGTIGPGTYQYEFQLTLPSKCPSSFEGSVGNIRYYVEGRIGKSAQKKDHYSEISLNVHSPVEVNEPSQALPVQQTQRKQVGCLCCAAGDIELSVEVPRTGFLINEDSIPLRVTVENGSTRALTIRASIIKHLFFHAQQGHKNGSSTAIVVQNSEPIQPRSTVSVDLPALKVPSTEPTIWQCSNIKLVYELQIAAEISWSLDLYVQIPIVLGDTKSSAPTGAQASATF